MTTSLESPSLGRGEKRFRRARSPAAKLAVRAERRQIERRKFELVEAGLDLAQFLSLRISRNSFDLPTVARSPADFARSFVKRLEAAGVLDSEVNRIVEWINNTTSGATAAKGTRTPDPRRKADETEPPEQLSASVSEPASAAFSAGPRARAMLRGVDLAAEDLVDSGGSYSLAEVRRLLHGVSRQSIEKRVREGGLLAVIGPNNKRFYPVAQFNDDGSVIAGLRAVQDALATRNGYAVLNFLVNPDPRLDNLRPLDLLKRGEVERVVEAAARSGEQGG